MPPRNHSVTHLPPRDQPTAPGPQSDVCYPLCAGSRETEEGERQENLLRHEKPELLEMLHQDKRDVAGVERLLGD